MLIDWKLDKRWVKGLMMHLHKFDPFLLEDSESIDMLEQIYNLMSVIKPEDKIDNMRHLWIETNDGWYCVVVGRYKDYTWLKVTDCEYQCSIFCNQQNENTTTGFDFVNEMSQLNAYIADLMDKYENNIEAYNKYIERYLPKSKRTGYISRKAWNEILGDEFKDIDKVKLLRRLDDTEVKIVDRMDMETYARLWTEGYKAYTDGEYDLNNEKKVRECFSHNLESYKWDDSTMHPNSEDDFFRWVDIVQHHHGLQIIYARVGLYPTEQENTLLLACNHTCFIKDFFKIMSHYIDINAPVNINSPHIWKNILTESDKLKISPNPFLYMVYNDEDKIYEEKKLPDELDKGTKKRLLAAIDWDPVEKIVLEQ